MEHVVLVNEIKPPKIIDTLAKFDGRKKAYVPDTQILEEVGKAKQLEMGLLAKFQTKWEQLRQAYPDNINKLKDTKKYSRKACAYHSHTFLIEKHRCRIIYFDKRWWRWDLLLQQYNIVLNQQIRPIDAEGFLEFQSYAHQTITQTCQIERRVKQAYKVVNRFIDYQNKHFMLNDYRYPNIKTVLPLKFNPLLINNDWITKGKQINEMVRAVSHHWTQTSEYSLEEILGWLVYSGIMYGGINSKAMLESWLEALINEKYQPFINKRLLISVRFLQAYYGNERSNTQNQLYNTQQIVLDMVSQCWLLRYRQVKNKLAINDEAEKILKKSAESYLINALKPVLNNGGLTILTFPQMLSYASYYWEMLDGADIDQASVSVLSSKQNTAGLTKEKFKEFLERQYKKSAKNYDLDDILKLSIKGSENILDKSSTPSLHGRKVRRSELITDIASDFKIVGSLKSKRLGYKPLTLIERIEKRYEQYTAVNERVFLDWILALLKDELDNSIKSTSVLQYIRSIGYEWLYFSMNQPIDVWDEEDFEMLYEDILEYKTTVRRHINISYYAKLLQRLHNFAHKNYGLPQVTIAYEKEGRRVRAELISPHMYHAIITQILHSVDILEREMFALMFMLVYRTGMRKKELLGLRYIDIEGLNSPSPSLVIRSNPYRDLKTAGSNRRIPIYALLQPDELALFIRYTQSTIGLNPRSFIFTLSSEKTPIDDHVPLQLLRRILQDIPKKPGNKLEQTFHAFRHTAVTNLSLVLCGDSELAQALTDYNEEDIKRIKYGVLGEHLNAQDRWYALSGIMGHLSPQRSFEYYNHIAVLMATYALSGANIKLPADAINNITGINRKKLKENDVIIDHNDVSLTSVRKLLFRSLGQRKYEAPRLCIKNTNLLIDLQSRTETLFMRYGMNNIWFLLQQNALGIALKQAAIMVNIDLHDADIIINRAQKVANVTSSHDNPRFVGANGLPKSIEYKSDYRLLSSLQNSARKLRYNSLDDWQWFIALCQENLSYSKAFIPFSIKEKKALRRFIKIAKQLLPAKNWLVVYPAASQVHLNLADMRGLRSIIKDNIGTFNIGIALIDNRSSVNGRWQFSPLLRFFVYMVLITDEELVILDNAS